MPIHKESQLLPYSPRQIFDLVADIKAYPQFLPWCIGARILEEHEDYVVAQLLIGYKHLRESYTSKVYLNPPADEHGPASIHVELVKGPFDHLTNHWEFVPEGEHTRVDFMLDFQFKSLILDKLIGGFFFKVTQKMVQAFKDRADQIYK